MNLLNNLLLVVPNTRDRIPIYLTMSVIALVAIVALGFFLIKGLKKGKEEKKQPEIKQDKVKQDKEK